MRQKHIQPCCHLRERPGIRFCARNTYPIAIGSTTVGVLSVDQAYDERASLDEDVRVLSIVASLIANDVKTRRAAQAERQALEQENLRLHHEMEDRFRPENIIGNSNAMREVYKYDAQARREAMSDQQRLLFHQQRAGPLNWFAKACSTATS